jgi:hypothetical protein
VVDFRHALQEKEDYEQEEEIKNRNRSVEEEDGAY